MADRAGVGGVAVVPKLEVSVSRFTRRCTAQGPELGQDATPGEDGLRAGIQLDLF